MVLNKIWLLSMRVESGSVTDRPLVVRVWPLVLMADAIVKECFVAKFISCTHISKNTPFSIQTNSIYYFYFSYLFTLVLNLTLFTSNASILYTLLHNHRVVLAF